MKFFHYLFHVGAFILGSTSLYIPPGQTEDQSGELARPGTPSTPTSGPTKNNSWPSHVAERRIQKQSILARRTTDEDRPNSQNVNQGINARKGPVTYTSEKLAQFREEYNAAKKASDILRRKVQRAKDAGLEVSSDDINELSRLSTVAYQQRLVFYRARKGKPLDRRTSVTRLDVTSLEQDPEVLQAVKFGVYTAQQLAEYKRSFLDALTEFRSKKNQLRRIAKVREISEAEEEALSDLQSAYNLQKRTWDRARKGNPTGGEVVRPKISIDALLENPKLQQAAQSSGYSVRELAEAKRSYLNAYSAARSFTKELEAVQKVRPITDGEDTQLQTLREAVKLQKRRFDRMCRGRVADDDAAPPRRDRSFLRKDGDIQTIAQVGGYSVEQVTMQKRAYLDALYVYREATKSISAVKKRSGILTPNQEDHFLKIDKAYQLHKTRWDRMNKGEQVNLVNQPDPEPGYLAKIVVALRRNAQADEIPYSYTPEQITMYDQRYLDALQKLHAFQHQISLAERSGRPIALDEEDELKRLLGICDQLWMEWARVRQGLYVDSVGDDGGPVMYTTREIQGYNQLHLDALRKLRAAEKKIAAGREAGHAPTLDEEAHLRALRDDFNKKKKMWTHARNGKPVDPMVHEARARSGPRSERLQESLPRRKAPASKAEPKPDAEAKADSSSRDQPLQMVGHHLFAPVISSATRFLKGLSRQWRAAMPWTHSLAKPRLNVVKPPELLRTEPALL
ncbi:MAG: hypothetical protein M1826_007299 [Phylliscum demangeonii]|nr:MAG: hypothetical protein M1826_007299 [Phylliscum demangeonii]